MTQRIIVGLTGLRGSGKDTAAKVLIEKHGFTVVKFADPLKNMLRQYFKDCGASLEYIERCIEGDLKELPSPYLLGKTPRHAMITLGTEWGRDLIGGTVWTSATLSAIDNVSGNVVVTDLRFENEYNVLKGIGAKMFRIERGLQLKDTHPSETYIRTMPVKVIENSGSIELLHRKLELEVFSV